MEKQGQDSHKSEEWRRIAREVHSLIRSANGLELFRDQTRQAASEYVSVRCECQRREEQRLDLLKKSGVLPGVEDLPDRPVDDKKKWVVWSEIIRGGLKKPIDSDAPIPPKRPDAPDEIRGVPTNELTAKQSKVKAAFKKKLNAWVKADKVYCLANFRFVKKLGFPNDTKCDSKYVFDLQGWIPAEMSPDHDPNLDLPLPVPERKLKLAEKFAGLSAVYDAHWHGETKIAPWGTKMPDEAEVLSGLPHSGVSEDQFQQANWYYFLVHAAKELDVDQILRVESWLADVGADIPKPALSDRQNAIVRTLLMRESFDSEHRLTRGELATALDAEPSRAFGQAVSELRTQYGYTESKVGKDGGIWLTLSGIEYGDTLT